MLGYKAVAIFFNIMSPKNQEAKNIQQYQLKAHNLNNIFWGSVVKKIRPVFFSVWPLG